MWASRPPSYIDYIIIIVIRIVKLVLFIFNYLVLPRIETTTFYWVYIYIYLEYLPRTLPKRKCNQFLILVPTL